MVEVLVLGTETDINPSTGDENYRARSDCCSWRRTSVCVTPEPLQESISHGL